MTGNAGVREDREPVDVVEGWQPARRRSRGPGGQLGIVGGSAVAVAVVVGVGSLVAARTGQHELAPADATAPAAQPDPVVTAAASDGATETTDPPTPAGSVPAGELLPVTLHAPGWTCLPAADEKFDCSNGKVGAAVTVRPADQHDAYLGDPDKAAPGQYVSDVHDGWFATLTIFPADADVSATDLGAALVWH
jgi:hypothetical protein